MKRVHPNFHLEGYYKKNSCSKMVGAKFSYREFKTRWEKITE